MSKELVKAGAFDDSPITFGDRKGRRVVLSHCQAVIDPNAEDSDIADALRFAEAAAESSPYWVGDLVAFVEDRQTKTETASQILAATGLAPHTLTNLASISRRVKPRERVIAPTIGHADVVAAMPAAEQRKWLTKARDEGWKIREFRLEVHAAQKRGSITEPDDLKGTWRTWCIDYPWKYSTSQPSTSNAQRHYPGMTLEEGLAWAETVRPHVRRQAVSFWWVTAPFLYYATEPSLGPDPYRIIRACGFEPVTGGVWDKVKHNFGHYFSVRHEHLIIATRGDGMTPDRPTPMIDSVFTVQASDEHSEKPIEVIKAIERMYDGPYIEVFARAKRRGWTTWGNQVGKLKAQ